MKKTFLSIPILLVLGCSSGSTDAKPVGDSQTLELTANGKVYHLNAKDDVISAAYGGSYFILSGLSEKRNLSFTLEAYMASLEKGDFKAFTCLFPSQCSTADEKQKGSVIFQPYPTGVIDISKSRVAYLAPSLNLQPLIGHITEVKDEQQAGNPRKTKLVKGTFSGTLAFVQQQADNSWKILETTTVSGKFNMYCSLH